MKIAWFSPLMPAHSDIANFTERLRGELNERFDMRFLTEKRDGFLEPSTAAFYHAGLGSCPYDLLVTLNLGDLPIYNLGNNPMFFSQTWFLNQFKPGIVILHDVKMHHFFEGLYRGRLRDEKRYLDQLEEYHGPIGRAAGMAYSRSRVSIEFMAEQFPMTAWALRNALGVVVHTPYAYEKVRAVTSVPVRMIPLPYRPQTPPEKAERLIGPNAFSPDHRAKLIIFGYLHTNRRIIEFLHVLASMEGRDCFEVHIVGALAHEREVNAAVDLLALRDRVTIYGHVPEERLEMLLAAADLAVNLRYPSMGEASGSQLRIWDHALPSLVTRTEAYASLPSETVCFVRPEKERLDIQRHLRHFLRRPELFREKGRRARQTLLARHLPAMYTEALAAFCAELNELRSRHNRFRLADRVGRATARWTGSGPIGDRADFYAARIAEIV